MAGSLLLIWFLTEMLLLSLLMKGSSFRFQRFSMTCPVVTNLEIMFERVYHTLARD